MTNKNHRRKAHFRTERDKKINLHMFTKEEPWSSKVAHFDLIAETRYDV